MSYPEIFYPKTDYGDQTPRGPRCYAERAADIGLGVASAGFVAAVLILGTVIAEGMHDVYEARQEGKKIDPCHIGVVPANLEEAQEPAVPADDPTRWLCVNGEGPPVWPHRPVQIGEPPTVSA